MRQYFLLSFALCLWFILIQAAPAVNSDNHLIKRQDDTANPVAPVLAPEPLVPEAAPVTSAPVEILSENLVDSGDATACGKKVQSEKPSDPAGEFLKCYMPGGF